jgi:anti-sigma B factor antagonist
LWQQDENIISIAADLSGTAFIDSTALAALISGMKTARQRGGDFVVANPSDVVKLIFDLTQMHKAFEIVDTLDEAVALLQE